MGVEEFERHRKCLKLMLYIPGRTINTDGI